MSKELEPCPFCGETTFLEFGTSARLGYGHPGFVQCNCVSGVSASTWNKRPLEDALRDMIAQLQSEKDSLTIAHVEMAAEIARLRAAPVCPFCGTPLERTDGEWYCANEEHEANEAEGHG